MAHCSWFAKGSVTITSMTWLLLALFAPLMFAASGFIDKYAISKVAANASAGALLILSGLCCVPLAIVFGTLGWHDILSAHWQDSAIAFAAGSVEMIGWYFYFKALDKADASLVIALYQMSIAINYVLGSVFLGEHLTLLTTVAIALIGGGAVAINIENHQGKLRFNRQLFALAVLCTFLVSLGTVLFKISAVGSNFLAAQFWMYAANCVVGCGLLVAPTARRSFWQTVRPRPGFVFGLSFINEMFYLIGVLAQNYAVLLAPVAVVQAVLGMQSIYMIAIGALLTHFWPHIITENISRKHLLLKISTVSTMVVGMILLAF